MPSPSAYSGPPLRAACSANEPAERGLPFRGPPPRQPLSSRERGAPKPVVRFTTLTRRSPSLVGTGQSAGVARFLPLVQDHGQGLTAQHLPQADCHCGIGRS